MKLVGGQRGHFIFLSMDTPEKTEIDKGYSNYEMPSPNVPRPPNPYFRLTTYPPTWQTKKGRNEYGNLSIDHDDAEGGRRQARDEPADAAAMDRGREVKNSEIEPEF
jgi:hypothetical protein